MASTLLFLKLYIYLGGGKVVWGRGQMHGPSSASCNLRKTEWGGPV